MKNQKREQLKQMLINKFRVKYGIKADVDNFDAIIRDEVETLMQNNALTEHDLTQMDKRLRQRLSINPEEINNEASHKPALHSSASQRSIHSRV